MTSGIIRKPGPGWVQHPKCSSVFDHVSGMRLHMIGLVRMPNGDWLRANEWPRSRIARECIRITGGNRKRGLMIWSMVMLRVFQKVQGLRKLREAINVGDQQ